MSQHTIFFCHEMFTDKLRPFLAVCLRVRRLCREYAVCAAHRGALANINSFSGLYTMRRIRLPLLASIFAALASPAFAQVGADPQGSSPLLAALQWVQGTLLGNLATSAAVIAVAVVGYMMLTGRLEWRRGLMVVVGAFIIFGAVSIVAGIRQLAQGLH